MRLLYETERLNAYLVDASTAARLLAYECRNREAFQPYSVTYHKSYYTHASFLHICERQADLYVQKRMLPLLFTAKGGREHTIATVQLNHIVWKNFRSAKIGYSVDERFWNQQYGTEAVQSVIDYAFNVLKLNRLEVNIHPQNEASLHLAVRLGFENEGVSRSYLYLNGKWQDHLRFSLLNKDMDMPAFM